MRRASLVCLLALLLFFQAAPVLAAEKLTANDWRYISRQRKIYFALDSMEMFQSKGILFKHTMGEYIHWMDKAAAGRSAANDDMDKVFADLVGKHEANLAAKIS